MKFIIKHEIKGRIRISLTRKFHTVREADVLEQYLLGLDGVTAAKVYERTADAVIYYKEDREAVLVQVAAFDGQITEKQEMAVKSSGRALNQEYKEKLIQKVLTRFATKTFLPAPVRAVYTSVQAIRYIVKGIHCLVFKRKLHVEVLDATAISVSLLRRDFNTAGSVMFLLGVGELLEEWTHKKSVGDLARSMSLNVEKVWKKVDGTEVFVPLSDVTAGDELTVHMGTVIPLDGVVVSGEAMVNQASMTGESQPVRKEPGSYVYAGTALEEGEITFKVEKSAGSTRYERIVQMIEDSEKLKSSVEGKASNLADALVPWSLGGTALTYLLTRNATKALSILMVDFSCALKLAMPVSVLSAIREAGSFKITVKGGKFLEAVAEADTIVFDKTGTLTEAKPIVAKVISFNGYSENELLRIAACLEEHFPHSMAKAVVNAAKERHLDHEEMHTKVEYIVAHGISTTIEGKKAVIGSHHFIFEDEKCTIPEGMEDRFENLPEEYSHLYLAIQNELAAVICIEDPLRKEAAQVVEQLREAGLSKIVMMTGDSDRTAKAIAKRVGVDEYYSEVLPEDKANFVEREKQAGRKVIMIGDGINDSPALSAADVGIAISEGAEIAREVADITVGADDLKEIVKLKRLSDALMQRIRRNYRIIVGFNTGLIVCGVTGVLPPTTSALLHNTSTLVIGLQSMKNLLDESE